MNLNSAFRLAVITALGLGASGFGPGSCGPGLEPEPALCEGLSEEACIDTEGCAPTYFQTLCACAPCAREDDPCPPCDCDAPQYAGCGVQQPDQPPPPPPPSPCENLDEQTCIAHPACRPVYFEPEPGTRCGPAGRCLGAFAGCVDGPTTPPPPPCELLEERACLQRADCEPAYDRCADGERCGGGFAGCRTACAPVACAMWCENGFARDARGCEICACAEPGCSSDRDCAAGQRCVSPEYEAGDEGRPAPRGVCIPGPRECLADSDCAPGERCLLPDCATEADCRGFCEPFSQECRADADCGVGEVCRQDPTHPCSWGPCPMHEPAPPMLCLPACSSLDERSCSQRPDCGGVYGSACDSSGNCTPDREFRCEDANGTCEPVLCDMWCPNGFQRDARGCEICACIPGCRSDADCAPGERCEAAMETCDPAGNCAAYEGVCRPAGCRVDHECGPGMVCLGCPPNALCELPGVCAPQGACLSDANCAAGESCIFLMYDCLGEDGLPCWGFGFCSSAEPGCTSDSDCAAGQRCELLDSCTALGCPPPGGVCRDLGCEGLDETSCLRHPGCSATYVPSGQGGQMVFQACQTL